MSRPPTPLLLAIVVFATTGCSSALRSITSSTSAPLSIEVRDAAGAPLAGALVRIRPAYAHVPGTGEPLALQPRGGKAVKTDDAGVGRFTVPVDQPLEVLVFAPDGRTGTLLVGHPGRIGEDGWQPLVGPDGAGPVLEVRLLAGGP